jgi:hypothetical protein
MPLVWKGGWPTRKVYKIMPMDQVSTLKLCLFAVNPSGRAQYNSAFRRSSQLLLCHRHLESTHAIPCIVKDVHDT